jgi:hypothetical protein
MTATTPRRAARATTLALLSAGAVAGCGSSAATTTPAHAHRASGPSDRPPAVRVSRAVRAEEASVHREVTSALRAGADSHQRYGGIPIVLRGHQAPPRQQVLTARPGHPAEPISGIAVRVHLPGGSALALGVGPYVPVRDQGSFHNHTPATWRVTFSDVHGTVPVRPSMFTLLDEQGQVLTPRVSLLGGGRVPADAPRGRSITIVLAARTLIGAGTIRYAPSGGRPLAGWDYDAETD